MLTMWYNLYDQLSSMHNALHTRLLDPATSFITMLSYVCQLIMRYFLFVVGKHLPLDLGRGISLGK